MSRPWFSFGMPLLAKELAEQAQRRSTYLYRVVYAGLLFAGACLLFYGDVFQRPEAASLLGQGRGMFRQIVLLQFWAICVFFPPLACSAITSEKERDCLALLLVTTMGPWEILLQKLLSRLLPMYSFLLLSLPLMAVAYSHGGVTESDLWTSIVLLALTCLQVGAVSMVWSSFFRTTPEALVATYLSLALFGACCLPALSQPRSGGSEEEFFVAMVFESVIAVLVCLVAARAFLVFRAFVPPRNILLIAFQALDRMFNDANHITGGVVLVRDSNLLPGERPVAWRETAKRSLGTVRYNFRVLCALMVPILIVGTHGAGTSMSAMATLHDLLWPIAVGLVAAHAAGVVSSERSRQTLSVLLSTPIPGREIVRQKLAGVRRLMVVLAVPFASVVFFEHGARPGEPWTRPLLQMACVAVYLPLTAWVAFRVGLRVSSQVRAIMTTLVLITAWAALPVGVRYAADKLYSGNLPVWVRWVYVFSPVDVIEGLALRDEGGRGLPLPLPACVLINLAAYSLLWLLIQVRCLERADIWLGRLAEPRPGSRRRIASPDREPRPT